MPIDIASAHKLIQMEAKGRPPEPTIKQIFDIVTQIQQKQNELDTAKKGGNEKDVQTLTNTISEFEATLKEMGVTDSKKLYSVLQMNVKNIDETLFQALANQVESMFKIDYIVKLLSGGKAAGSASPEKTEESDEEDMLMFGSISNFFKTIKTSLGIIQADVKSILFTVRSMSTMMMTSYNDVAFIANNQAMTTTLVKQVSEYQVMSTEKLALELENMSVEQMTELETKLDPVSFKTAIKEHDKRQKLKDSPFGAKLLEISDKTNAFRDRLFKMQGMMKAFASPMQMISGMWSAISLISKTIFRVILPTLISMAVTFFTTVLPIILIVVAAVILLVIVLFLLWKHFGKQIKMVWGFIKQYVVDFLIMTWNNLKEFVYWAWDTLKFIWGIITDVYDFVDSIFSGDFVGAGKIIVRLMDRIVAYVSSTFEHIFNIFGNFGEFLSKLPIIGPVFKFLFGIFMPFMRFFMDAFKWVYSFIKDYISLVWNSLVDSIGLIKAIFTGDFTGAGVIVKRMFDRFTEFLFDKVISLLIILQKLGDSLLIPIMWLWDTFKVAWDYYSDIAMSVFGWIGGILKSGWESVSSTVEGIWGSLKKTWEYISDLPDKLMGGVKNIIGGISDALNPFNWFAEGGIVTGPTKAVIGEAGPEAVIPLSGSSGNNFSKILSDFFDTYLPFFKPLVDFLWSNFKPLLPIIQVALDSIYNVVYGIISGLANLPGWLGGGFFAAILTKMAAPSGGAAGGPKADDKNNMILSVIGDVSIGDKTLLAAVGNNGSYVHQIDNNRKPAVPVQFGGLGNFVSNVGNSMGTPEYAKTMQNTMNEISEGIDTLAGRLKTMEKNIIGAVGTGGNSGGHDKQFEMTKLMSNNSFNGGKI